MGRNALGLLLAFQQPSSLNVSGLIVDGRSSTHSSRSVFFKADVQRIMLTGDRGEQRESREQPGTFNRATPRPPATAAIAGW